MLIPGTNSIKDTGYKVTNSCRFDRASSDDFSKSTSGGSQRKATFSAWIKRGTTGAEQGIFESHDGSAYFSVYTDGVNLRANNTGGTGDYIYSNAKLRDHSAWYHVCIAVDSEQAVAANRFRMYLNGTEVTSFSATVYPAEDEDMKFNGSGTIKVGDGAASQWDGYMAEVCWIDGLQLTPTSFGEFNEDTPTVFQPIDVSGLTFGTNGFYLDFEDSANLGNDANGGTDLTENNIVADNQSTDTPTNNFATANPLNVNSGGVATFAEGNLEVTSPTATGMQFMSSSTIGMTAGKWYCEVKIKTVDSGMVGVSAGASEDARDDYPPGTQGGAESVGILISSGARYIDDGGATHGAATSADGIMMIALDLDNNNVYFGTGGNWFDGSGNADEAAPNSAISVTAVGSTTDGAYFFSVGDGGGSSACKVQWNFGNPPFSISSGNSDANGYGNFEYSVPSGYLRLCTKNLGSDGG